MNNLNVIEILKVGLPGLVFLLSLLSFRLLSKEQDKKEPSEKILNSIKLYMYINVGLAVLTLASPMIDRLKEANRAFEIRSLPVSVADTGVKEGEAVVCLDTGLQNRYILVADNFKVVEAFGRYGVPCVGESSVRLSKTDLKKLDWNSDMTHRVVDVVVANECCRFVVVKNSAVRQATSYSQ